MSWLLGFIGSHLTADLASRFQALHPQPRCELRSRQVYLAAGGLAETCLHGSFSPRQTEAGWAICGVGLEFRAHSCRFINAADWQQILAAESPPLKKLDGHFVAVKWKSDQIECFTDQLGLRTLFLIHVDNGTAFSTRLDWIAALREHNEIDFAACGSSWLTFNQIGHEALLKNVLRLGPNGVARLSPTSTKVQSTPWTPNPDHIEQNFAECLRAFLHPSLAEAQNISLGLSGGLDSRTLLALLASPKNAKFWLHVFGNPEDPDVQISQAIARQENFSQRHFDAPIPDAAACMRWLSDYASQTQFIEPASTMLNLRYFPQLYAQKKIIIDGGFGEIARRQFLNRLWLKGKSALQSGDPQLIYPYLHVPRPRIFAPEVFRMMQKGVETQIAELLEQMPAREFDAANFLELFAIRTRLANAYSFEQARMDGECVSYMPFAQPSVLNALFKTPVTMRKNGRLFRQLIRHHFPPLAHYPLVKSGIVYPFTFTTVPAWAWTRLKTKLGQKYSDVTAVTFLHNIAAEVQDLVHSDAVKSYPAYDYPFIRNMVEKFYGGQTELAPQVHWWLAFEMWRRAVKS